MRCVHHEATRSGCVGEAVLPDRSREGVRSWLDLDVLVAVEAHVATVPY